MRVLLLSRYGSLGASSRVRSLQYLPYFRAHGVTVEVTPLFSDAYLKGLYSGRSLWREVLAGYARRAYALARARQFDLLIVEKELFPFLPAAAERLLHAMGRPYVADYDDALFHRYDCHRLFLVRRFLGRKIDSVMQHASLVVAGNEYLAVRAWAAGANRVEVVPSVVDMERYRSWQVGSNEVPIVGWIGTPQTSFYLQPLLPVFEALQKETSVRFVAVGAHESDFRGTLVEVWPWSEESEVAAILQFDIGIMPLKDSAWEQGKCGYKLLQYMACGIPVVASPVGVNRQIVTHGENGFLAATEGEWLKALKQLLEKGVVGRKALGTAGRERVEGWYSLDAQAPRLLAALKAAVR